MSATTVAKFLLNVSIVSATSSLLSNSLSSVATQSSMTASTIQINATSDRTITAGNTTTSARTTVLKTSPDSSSVLMTSPNSNSVLMTSPNTTSVLTISPSSTSVLTTCPDSSSVLMTSPNTNSVLTISPSSTSVLTISPSSTSVQTTRPSSTSVLTTSPSSTSELTTRPSSTSVLTTRPSSTSVLTTRPSSTSVLTTRPSSTSVLTTRPSSTLVLTTSKESTSVVTTYVKTNTADMANGSIGVIVVSVSGVVVFVFLSILVLLIVLAILLVVKRKTLRVCGSPNKRKGTVKPDAITMRCRQSIFKAEHVSEKCKNEPTSEDGTNSNLVGTGGREYRGNQCEEVEHKNEIYGLYNEANSVDASGHEIEPFWMPSSDYEEIYEKITEKKYLEIPRDQIKVLSHLGSGEFGTVSEGLWQSGAQSRNVALKMLKCDASPRHRAQFLQEAAINGQFRHENVVLLYGVVTAGNPIIIVLELLNKGDLRNYLLKHRPAESSQMAPSIGSKELLLFCQQVASGMSYLSRKGFVHRDLAARNILLSEKNICKIADFGMSRNLDENDYYVSQGGQIPVKWTAPEAIQFKKYSTQSDVWSFGAVMYEIWSLGCKPYEAYTNQQVITMISSGVRAAPPPGCPRAIYKLIIKCWNPDKDQRPSFAFLDSTLQRSSDTTLAWSPSDIQTYPEARVLGAPLEYGQPLYKDLQNAYLVNKNIYN